MPPIPKFAKALAKLAKANPKVISGETPPKIKKRNTSEKTIEKQIETKKFAKDDMEIDKNRREKAKKELEQSLPKKAKDDSELLSIMKELRSSDISQLENSKFYQSVKKLKDMDMSDLSINKISDFIENLKNAFETSKEELSATDSIVMPINAIIDILGKINPNDKKNYINEEKELTSILTQLETIN